jgi:hypothetical protein
VAVNDAELAASLEKKSNSSMTALSARVNMHILWVLFGSRKKKNRRTVV